MKIKELIELLNKVDPDLEVVLSKDAEGNNFSPFHDFTSGNYEAETNASYGEFYCEKHFEEMRIDLEQEEQMSVNAICLWPIE